MRSHKERANLFLLVIVSLSVTISFFAYTASAEYAVQPRLAVSETYDSNIDLVENNKKSDFITTISPGVSFFLFRPHYGVELAYDLNLEMFAEYDDNNIVGHAGKLDSWYEVNRHLKFKLIDTLVKANDPRDAFAENDVRFASGRSDYIRNTVRPSAEIAFARNGLLEVAYQNLFYDNSDDTIQDSSENLFYASVGYKFSVRHEALIHGEYKIADFGETDNASQTNDFDSYRTGGTYTYNFTRQTSGFLNVDVIRMDFKETDVNNPDYYLYNGDVGMGHQFTKTFKATASVGYYYRSLDEDGSDQGVTANAELEKTGKHYTVRLGGFTGPGIQYFGRENLGFVENWSIYGVFDYNLLEKLYLTAGADFERSKYPDEQSLTRDDWAAHVSLNYLILTWLAARGGYDYYNRDSDEAGDSYDDHRVFLTLTASYTWPPNSPLFGARR